MKNYRYAFTMIELIFVIVILGVLAAVALPMFTATRNDAETSKLANNIMTGTFEVASYAVSQGQVDNNLSVMSNAIKSMLNTGDAVLDVPNKRAIISVGSIIDCVTIEIVTTATDENLTVSFGNANSDSRCESVQSVIDTQIYPIKIRGQYVSYQ